MHARAQVIGCIVALLVVQPLSAQRRTLASFNGVWRHAGSRVERPDSVLNRPPMTGVSIIYNGHFSQVYISAPPSGAQQASRVGTAEEKAARYDLVSANAGSFKLIDDSTLIANYEVAKSPATMGTSLTAHYRLVGDSLWQTTTSRWSRDTTKTVRTTNKYIRQK